MGRHPLLRVNREVQIQIGMEREHNGTHRMAVLDATLPRLILEASCRDVVLGKVRSRMRRTGGALCPLDAVLTLDLHQLAGWKE
jgi:hypothetical protein